MPFDLASHQRQRIRALERETQHLQTARRQLERLLAITLTVATGSDCDPLTLLAVIEQLEKDKRVASVDELAQLLRETDPAGIRRAA